MTVRKSAWRLWRPLPELGVAPDASPFVQLEPGCADAAGRRAVARAIAASVDAISGACLCPRLSCRRAGECRADASAAGPHLFCRARLPADLVAAMALACLTYAREEERRPRP